MKRLLKLALALTITVASLNLTAKPLQAVTCFNWFMGCQFVGYTYIDIYECCTYECDDGSTKLGACGIA